MFKAIAGLIHPVPEEMRRQGFEPNLVIRSMRAVARGIISLLRLHGASRFSNEFIQMLDPRLTVKLPDGGSIVFRTGHGRLLWRARAFASQEPLLLQWIDTFDPDDVFYDVGANVGPYSIYAARRRIATYAFEPELSNVQVLYENIFLNQVQQWCTPVPLALGDQTRTDVFFLKSTSKGDALHAIGRPSYLLTSHAPCQLGTLVMSLDDLIRAFGLPPPTRLKIDVDSNELQILHGASRALDNVRGIYIEIDEAYEEHRQALRLLKQRGFELVETESQRLRWSPAMSNCLFQRRAA
jgi:FkbM family methyltransferase